MRLALAAVAGLMIAPAAAGQDGSGAANQDGAASTAEIAQLVESCSARKFETIVQTMVDGKLKRSRIRLCSKPGATDADWVKTLTDAVEKLRDNPKLTQDGKDQAIAALTAEIAKVKEESTATQAAPALVSANTGRPIKFDLPSAPAPAAAPSDTLAGYSTLPPLATPPSSAAPAAGRVTTAASAPPKPSLTIRCTAPSDLGALGPCDTIEQGTVVIVRADEALPPGLSLRFLRKGEVRGEVALAQAAQGQALRVRTPARLCAGVIRSRAEIQIVKASPGGAAQVIDSRGPFELDC